MNVYPSYTINYGSGATKSGTATDDPIDLPTQGKLMAHDLQIYISPIDITVNNQDKNVTQTSQTYTYSADSGYSGIGSITVTAQTANPAFKGGDAHASADFSHSETNVTTTDTDTGIYIQPDVSVDYSRASVLYNGAVNGWVNKANNAVAMEAETYMPEMGLYEPIYISGVTVPSGKTFTVVNNGTTNINGGNTDKGIQVNDHTAIVDGTTVTNSSGDLITANPTFNSGNVTIANSTISASGANISFTTASSQGLPLAVSASGDTSISSVTYAEAVSGYITKSSGDIAIAATSPVNQTLATATIYINGVTVTSKNSFTVDNKGTLTINSNASPNTGNISINGGGNKGVQVLNNREVRVDGYTVTYTAATTVNGVTYNAGNLMIPSYNSTTYELTYPAPGIFTTAGNTATLTPIGNVTKINGLVIRDGNSSELVKGSSSAYASSATNSYLAKWTAADTIGKGPRVQILTSAPTSTTGYSAGDIVFVV